MASGSPEKRHKQPLRIRMDLTETQVDRITDAFTHNINSISSSPMSNRQRAKNIAASRSTPLRLSGDGATSQFDQRVGSQHRANRSVEIRSPTFSELMPRDPRHKTDSLGLAERRQRDPPPPIHVIAARPVAMTPQRPALQAVPDLVSPLSAEKLTVGITDNESEPSMYLPEEYETQIMSTTAAQQPSPQRQRQKHCHQGPAGTESGSSSTGFSMNDEILKMYTDWVQVQSPPVSSDPRIRPEGSLHYGRRMPNHPSPPPHPRLPLAASRLAAPKKPDTPMFSPLPLYFRGQGFPTEKMGEKTMIGKNGWLERTRSPGKQSQTPQQQKRTGILDSIKKIAKEMSEQYHPSRRSAQPFGAEPPNSRILISLDTREQSLLYCELEFHITTALNDYITAELVKGRLVPDNLKKISDWWHQQGRPKVIGFRYDMETQLELINLHIHDFGFHGRRQGNMAEIAGLLHAMKVNARAMRIRTFCQPDSVIAKQLVDSQSLFNLINATDLQQVALAEVAQFFKVILEREREYRAKGALGPGNSQQGHS